MNMSVNRYVSGATAIRCVTLLAGLILMIATPMAAQQPATPEGAGQPKLDSICSTAVCEPATAGSPYIPLDSWVYPVVLRLYAASSAESVEIRMAALYSGLITER